MTENKLQQFDSNKKELKNDEYYTPKYVLDALDVFTYDPCSNETSNKYLGIDSYDDINTNGLLQDWNVKAKGGNIWINPPFTLKKEFLNKAKETIKSGFSGYIYFLLPAKSLTTKFLYDVLRDMKYHLLIPNKRINFINKEFKETKTSYFGSVIIKLNTNENLVINWDLN